MITLPILWPGFRTQVNLSWTTLQVNDYLSDPVTRFQDAGKLVVDDIAGKQL